MTDHKLDLGDGADTQDSTGTEPVAETPNRKTYVVTSEAGLFKNGTQYDQGSEIELDETTAENFKTNGDIKDA